METIITIKGQEITIIETLTGRFQVKGFLKTYRNFKTCLNGIKNNLHLLNYIKPNWGLEDKKIFKALKFCYIPLSCPFPSHDLKNCTNCFRIELALRICDKLKIDPFAELSNGNPCSYYIQNFILTECGGLTPIDKILNS